MTATSLQRTGGRLLGLAAHPWAPAAVIGLAFSLRLACVLVLHIEPYSDYASYYEMARSLAEEGRMRDLDQNVAHFSTGYPLLMGLIFMVTGASVGVFQAVNILLGALSTWLVYLCGGALFQGRRAPAVIAALLWAVYLPALLYTENLAKENLMTPLMLGQLLVMLRYRRTTRPLLMAAALGLLFAAQLVVGPSALLLVPIGFLVVLDVDLGRLSPLKWRWGRAALLALSLGVGLSPWLVYADRELGRPVLNSNGGFNLYLGNNPNATGWFVGIQDTPMAAEWHRLRHEQGELAATDRMKQAALEYMRDHPGRTLALAARKFFYFWTPPWHESKDAEGAAEFLIRKAWLLQYAILILLALTPLARPRRIDRQALILYASIFGFAALHMAAYVIFRYRLPIMSFVCLAGALGVLRLLGERRPAGGS